MDEEFETCLEGRIVVTTLGRWRICGTSIFDTLHVAELCDVDGRSTHSCSSAAADPSSGTDADSNSHAASSGASPDIDTNLGTNSNRCSARDRTAAAAKLNVASEHNWPADAYHDESCG
jgi:hypothetical protein